MAWTMKVRLLESCSCAALCPCILGPAKPDQGWCSGVFGIEVSIQMVLTCIIGGIGTVAGPVIGAVVVVLLSEALRASLSSAHLLVYGVLVIIVILTMPDGFVGFIAQRLRRKAAPA